MLKKKYKIQRTIFPENISKGKLFRSPALDLRVFFNKENSTTQPRFSFVVSAKVAKKAVVRNKLKRRGYAIIEKNMSNIKSGYTCVFFLKKESIAISFKELEREIIAILKQANVFS